MTTRGFLTHPLLIATYCALIIAGIISLRRTAEHSQEVIQTLEKLKSDTAQLQQENEHLSSKIEQAQTDLSQERILRDELLLQKPGEQVLQIPDIPIPSPSSPPSPTPIPWDEWKKIIF